MFITAYSSRLAQEVQFIGVTDFHIGAPNSQDFDRSHPSDPTYNFHLPRADNLPESILMQGVISGTVPTTGYDHVDMTEHIASFVGNSTPTVIALGRHKPQQADGVGAVADTEPDCFDRSTVVLSGDYIATSPVERAVPDSHYNPDGIDAMYPEIGPTSQIASLITDAGGSAHPDDR